MPVEDEELEERTCCGVIEESAARAREDRYKERPEPQPWLVQKFMVAITLGIMGYTGYVYLAVFVRPMIQEREGAVADRRTGIALLVPFCVLYAWVVWAYIKVITTPPGMARDHVAKSEKPLYPPGSSGRLFPGGEDSPIGRPSYEDQLKVVAAAPQGEEPRIQRPPEMARTVSSATIKSGSSHGRLRFNAGEMASPTVEESDETHTNDHPIAVPLRAASSARNSEQTAAELDVTVNPEQRRSRETGKSFEEDLERGEPRKIRKRKAKPSSTQPRTFVTRRPPTAPLLHPAFRYCERDGFIKPYRAHHCRVCATCVLKYDHHCPWIGQCVGAQNQKFFLNFTTSAWIVATYIFATVLPYTIIGFDQPTWVNNATTNPQQIAVIALAGVFGLFTMSLSVSHIYLTLRGQTTVESMHVTSMKKREAEQLRRAFSWWQIGAKQRMLKEWDREWGKLDTEANIWWMGSRRREWEAVMGKNWLGWILPIGKSESDGLDYPVNPRFGPEGKWRRREQWPAELR
ncbi:vacuole protein [Coprinopsis sp. MPI-PUGE-AT-0042]|nr:vacuole protein [Coprinopsis sp. MPI-PUGE-AT-0042]